ncbi:MAG TPA: 16S rRNA (cytosine(1402)-N(4))-methyltransferase RsmH [Vicinamibacterales bacterium]|jgi:16S rRNA (cytosine1402-N4)-methyltransferase|nr:16S rRNA (cytosine(1402)-N(4))-methyltransferase RsmH [Vicinamibacterales bacterium]
MSERRHDPVLVSEIVEMLAPGQGGLFVDCTVGLGGHAQALLDGGAARLLGLDRDPQALEIASATLARFGVRVELVHADYRDLDRVLDERSIPGINGALADLGVSSMQLDAEGRGFSFRRDEPLDMRMDRTRGDTAAELLRTAAEDEIANAIFQFGEERYSRRVARAIVNARRERPIATTGELATIVRRAVPHRGYQRIDPATRTFQGLRIWVNRELDGLDGFLAAAAARLLRGARLAVITFHSLEDRIVKHTFRALENTGESLRVLTRRPLVPGDDEIDRNPRARSAKLRVIERFA